MTDSELEILKKLFCDYESENNGQDSCDSFIFDNVSYCYDDYSDCHAPSI